MHCIKAILFKSSTLTARTSTDVLAWESIQAFDTGKTDHLRMVLLFLDQIKREKGVWWMPRQQEAMKDVVPCVKPWGAGNRL